MDAELIRRWNETVTDDDAVHIVGDFGPASQAGLVGQLRGEKHLVVGNNDAIVPLAKAGLFKTIRLITTADRYVMTHYPLHPSQFGKSQINVHGHLHGDVVGDPRYACVSVDHTDFRPLSLDEIPALAERQARRVG